MDHFWRCLAEKQLAAWVERTWGSWSVWMWSMDVDVSDLEPGRVFSVLATWTPSRLKRIYLQKHWTKRAANKHQGLSFQIRTNPNCFPTLVKNVNPWLRLYFLHNHLQATIHYYTLFVSICVACSAGFHSSTLWFLSCPRPCHVSAAWGYGEAPCPGSLASPGFPHVRKASSLGRSERRNGSGSKTPDLPSLSKGGQTSGTPSL